MKSTTVATFKEQLRQLFADLKHISKKHFGEKHDIVHAAKDLFEMALIECRPNVDSSQTANQKSELAKTDKESNIAECLKQELQQLKKAHEAAMKAQKAKYEQLKETFHKQTAKLHRLSAESTTKMEKLDNKQQFILDLYLENSELKEKVEKLTEEKEQLRTILKLQLTKPYIIHKQETQRFQTNLKNHLGVLETWF